MIEGLGRRLGALRTKKGLTQREAAAIPELGCEAGVLAAYEREIRTPKLDTIARFAQFYGVSTDYLLGLSEYETPEQMATSAGIPLTNEALSYLRTCDRKDLVTLSLILSVPSSEAFLTTLRQYIEDYDIRDEDGMISEKYHEINEALGRHLSDEEFVALVQSWAWDGLREVIEQMVKEIREARDLEDAGPRRGRPKKYKTKKTAAQVSRPWKKPPEGKD